MVLQIRAPQRESNADLKRADAEATRIKGLQREEKGDNKGTGRSGYADQGAEELEEGRQ